MVNIAVGVSDKVDMKKMYIFLTMCAAISVILAACNAEKITPPQVVEKTYGVDAILVRDLMGDSASIFVTLTKSAAAYRGADVYLGQAQIDTIATGYYRRFGVDQIQPGSTYVLTVVDDTILDAQLTLTMPDSFEVDKHYRLFQGGEEEVLWSPSVNADGYILATVPPVGVNDSGYTAYVISDRGTIPAATFLDSLSNKIVGTHMIYVAAYIGAPIKSPDIPFYIPTVNNPADNVSDDNIAGRIAGMVIASPDSIVVEN
jgi:hypothetical protein